MRRHVAGVGHRRGDIGKDMGRRQGDRGVQRIIEGVDHEMSSAGVVGITVQHAERNRSGPHFQPQAVVSQRPRAAQHGKRVEGRDLIIRGVLFIQSGHGLHVGHPAILPTALPPESFDRFKQALFPRGGSLGQAFFRRGSKPRERFPRRLGVDLGLQRVVVGEGFGPVGQCEVGIDRLGGPELLDRLLPAETVQDRHAAQEVLLRLPRCRCGEVDGADILELGMGRCTHRQRNECQRGGNQSCFLHGVRSASLDLI